MGSIVWRASPLVLALWTKRLYWSLFRPAAGIAIGDVKSPRRVTSPVGPAQTGCNLLIPAEIVPWR